MAWKLRVALALACLAAVGGLIAWGRLGGEDTAPGVQIDSASAMANRDCRQCHAEVWQEWETSLHAQSWTSPNVQAAFQHFGHDRQCESCHAPEPVAAFTAGAVVALRAEFRESGVDCLSCHALPENRVAAARTIAAAPCRPTATPLLIESRHCAACHVAIHKDWEESRYRAEGKTCQSCHMGGVASRPGGKSHLCLGGHDDDLVRSGVTMTCRQEGDELVVSVANHATGHNFPGERHNRVLLLQIIERRADGEIALARQAMIKDITPFRGESSSEQIRANETYVARFPVVEPPVTADVQLLYKRFPWPPDREALVVHRAEVKLE
jgi:hypothetical protein